MSYMENSHHFHLVSYKSLLILRSLLYALCSHRRARTPFGNAIVGACCTEIWRISKLLQHSANWSAFLCCAVGKGTLYAFQLQVKCDGVAHMLVRCAALFTTTSSVPEAWIEDVRMRVNILADETIWRCLLGHRHCANWCGALGGDNSIRDPFDVCSQHSRRSVYKLFGGKRW